MARYAVESGYDARISGGEFDGMNANDWGAQIFIPTSLPRLIGITVAVVIGLWEFCSVFPAEVVLWQRVTKQRPSRTSFAPWTTLILRYLMLCYSVTTAFIEWSTTMPTDAACKAASGFLFASWCALVVVCSFAIAWRAQAVARGVLQDKATVIAMQMMIGVLVLMQVFMAVFTVVWSAAVDFQYTPVEVNGQCTIRSHHGDIFQRKHDFRPRPFRDYVADVLLWYWVVLIVFNLCCLLLVIYALRTLAARSRGFSKFINGMLNHSVFYFALVLLLSIVCIIWRKEESASWLIRPTTVIEAAVMIRILLAEQNAARRPVDTTYMDQRHFSNRGYTQNAVDAQPVTYPRGDATIQFVNRNQGMERRSIDRMESGGGAGTDYDPNAMQDHPAMVTRPIYQPYSIMDNLGQAFSQVDSNTHDLDGQSLSSNRQSISGVQNAYPGVVMMEEEQRRLKMEAKVAQSSLDPDSMQDYEKGTSTAPSADISNTNGSSSSEKQQGKNSNTTSQTGIQTNRPTLRFLQRNRSHDDIDHGYENDDDDDELGIQTVNF
ncbi:uncharacterized protein FA14DRAFT_191455 [Meira miltonrushii]|uniref:Uncharacterized protein n=1 Tax=Meira miltonrushii TaxID=1280837 RepID=A0A316V9V6_9BASI|nr:uncharacterized protein FA14DRAFT_191455 [Meira miltonrushii]PWN34399.1 hypothetical protein FA14DRAFT_191455 [Meira miltonrushii]